MAYDGLNALTSKGFTINKNCTKFSELGVSLSTDNEFMCGDYWFYDTAQFTVNIHDFYIKKDFSFEYHFPKDCNIPLNLNYIKYASGECLTPYRQLESNSTFVNFNQIGSQFRSLHHSNTLYYSVGIEYKDNFLFDYVKQSYNIDKETLFSAFKSSENVVITKTFKKIADEIINYKLTTPGSELFYEIKAKEALSIIINHYFNQNKKTLTKDDETSIKIVANYIDDHYASDTSLELLSNIALMSKTKLKNSFKQYFGMTMTEYKQRRRIHVAEHMLRSSDLSVGKIASLVGYQSHSRFSALFKKYTNQFPKDYNSQSIAVQVKSD